VEIPQVDAPPTSGLVWMRDGSRDRTHWVALDGTPLSGQPIEGPLWADGRALWQLVPEEATAPIFEHEPSTSAPASTGVAPVQRLVLRELVSRASVVLLEAPSPGPAREIVHRVSLEGSVGRYLFVLERLYIDAWGAHGSEQARSLVWDLSAAARAEVATDRERMDWQRLAPSLVRGLPHVADGSEAALVALHPSWDVEAGLRVDLHLAVNTCYACGDGLWSDYTRSVLHPLPSPPERLATRLPAWVRVTAASAGGTLMGFTLVDQPEPARILDSLRR